MTEQINPTFSAVQRRRREVLTTSLFSWELCSCNRRTSGQNKWAGPTAAASHISEHAVNWGVLLAVMHSGSLLPAVNWTYSHAWPREPGNAAEWIRWDVFCAVTEILTTLTPLIATRILLKPWQHTGLLRRRRDRGSSHTDTAGEVSGQHTPHLAPLDNWVLM